MSKGVTAGNDVNGLRGGLALAEPPSSAATVRMAAPRDSAVIGPGSDRYRPEALADAGPLLEIGTALELNVINRVTVRNGPIADIAASRDGRRLVVSNHGDDSVSVIDTASGAILTLANIEAPFTIAAASAGASQVYVSMATMRCDSIAVIDLDSQTAVAEYSLGESVRDVTVSPDGRRVYVSRIGADGADVAILDTVTERIEVIDLAAEPGAVADCVALSPDGQSLYVATERPSGSALAVIDTRARRVIGTVNIGSPIRDIALNRGGDIAYVASCGSERGGVVDVVDTGAGVIAGSLEIGAFGAITQLVLSNDGYRVYLVTDAGVIVMSTLTYDVVNTVKPVAQPSSVAESADGNHLFVADYEGAVTVISIARTTSSLVGEFGDRPELLEHGSRRS